MSGGIRQRHLAKSRLAWETGSLAPDALKAFSSELSAEKVFSGSSQICHLRQAAVH